MNKAYVICCNYNIKYVILNDYLKASEKLKELKNKHFNKKVLHNCMSMAKYCKKYYWYIQMTEFEITPKVELIEVKGEITI
jgi:hypothetical protein